jgi:hypothetical protein
MRRDWAEIPVMIGPDLQIMRGATQVYGVTARGAQGYL